MTDKIRAKFEAAVAAKFKNVDFSLCTAEEGFILCVGEYKQPSVQTMWWAWQASLQDIELKLPQPTSHGDNEDSYFNTLAWDVDDVEEACTEAGVRISKC